MDNGEPCTDQLLEWKVMNTHTRYSCAACTKYLNSIPKIARPLLGEGQIAFAFGGVLVKTAEATSKRPVIRTTSRLSMIMAIEP